MTDEAKLKQQASRGERAKRILDDSLVKEAFTAIESAILDGWKGSAADEKEQRDNAYVAYRLLENFREQFTYAVATGEAARKELLTINDPSKIRRMMRGR